MSTLVLHLWERIHPALPLPVCEPGLSAVNRHEDKLHPTWTFCRSNWLSKCSHIFKADTGKQTPLNSLTHAVSCEVAGWCCVTFIVTSRTKN